MAGARPPIPSDSPGGVRVCVICVCVQDFKAVQALKTLEMMQNRALDL